MNVSTFARRFVRASEFGFVFKGTTHTRFPRRLRLGGKWRKITQPGQAMLVYDIIDVMLDDDYGLKTLNPPPRTIVDIGANIGTFSNFARHNFPAATIHAYEPDPATYASAAANLAHPLTRVFREGVAASNGHATLIRMGDSPINRTSASETGDVRLRSFAEVVARIGSIDLLKIDCEGAEWDFMSDPAPFAAVAKIRMEYHLVDGYGIEDVRALAPRLGFRITHLAENNGFGIVWMDRLSS